MLIILFTSENYFSLLIKIQAIMKQKYFSPVSAQSIEGDFEDEEKAFLIEFKIFSAC